MERVQTKQGEVCSATAREMQRRTSSMHADTLTRILAFLHASTDLIRSARPGVESLWQQQLWQAFASFCFERLHTCSHKHKHTHKQSHEKHTHVLSLFLSTSHTITHTHTHGTTAIKRYALASAPACSSTFAIGPSPCAAAMCSAVSPRASHACSAAALDRAVCEGEVWEVWGGGEAMVWWCELG